MRASETNTSAIEERAYRTCGHCAAWNLENATACRECGKTIDSSEADIKLTLAFSVEQCPSCGKVSPGSPCVHCGAEVPEVSEVSEVALARQKTFGKLLRRAEELLPSYDRLPEPHVSVAPEQYATALADARLLTRIRLVLRGLDRLNDLDFGDVAAIGGKTRRRLEGLIKHLEEIYRATEEIAWFRAPTPGVARARTAMIASGRHATEIVLTLLRALSETSLDEVVPLQARFQELLDEYPWAAEFDAALAELRELPALDLDERVGVALGTEVSVTDPLGLLDPARVLASFGGGGDPFTPLARASAGFLSHLTNIAVEDVTAEAAALALSALGLAVLDRPLPAHRAARQAVELVRAAENVDPAATLVLLERTAGEGPRIFAAAKRIHDDLLYVAEGHAQDEDDVVRRAVVTYKSLAESSFRSYLWFVVDAQDVAVGRTSTAGPRPMLGKLLERLDARDDPLSKMLVQAIDPLLRNAEAHEDFRFDARRGEIVLDGKRLSLAQLERRTERLVGATVALDAAVCCQSFDLLGSYVPQWLTAGEAPYASEMLTRGILAAYGIDVLAIDDGDDLIIEAHWPASDRARALTPLAALAQLFPHSRRLVLLVDGDRLIAVKTAAFRAFAEADERVKDLALLAPFYSAGVEAGRDPAEVLEDVLALFIGLIATVDVPQLKIALEIGNPLPLERLDARLEFIIRFVRERDPKPRGRTQKVMRSLMEAKSKITFVRRGDAPALSRMVAELSRVAAWADARGCRWPPI